MQITKLSLTIGGSDAFALCVFQESFLASASDHAVLGAYWTRIRVGASRWASSAARQENFVLSAFRDWWKHLE